MYVENDDTNEVWICKKDGKPIMYIDKSGRLHSPKDIVAYSQLPPVAKSKVEVNNDDELQCWRCGCPFTEPHRCNE